MRIKSFHSNTRISWLHLNLNTAIWQMLSTYLSSYLPISRMHRFSKECCHPAAHRYSCTTYAHRHIHEYLDISFLAAPITEQIFNFAIEQNLTKCLILWRANDWVREIFNSQIQPQSDKKVTRIPCQSSHFSPFYTINSRKQSVWITKAKCCVEYIRAVQLRSNE